MREHEDIVGWTAGLLDEHRAGSGRPDAPAGPVSPAAAREAAAERRLGAAFILARRAADVGLVVTKLVPGARDGWYDVQLWQRDGELWADGTSETEDEVMRHIHGYREREQVEVPWAGEWTDCSMGSDG